MNTKFSIFKRPHTEIAEDYWNMEYLDYSDRAFPFITIQTLYEWVSYHD